MSRITFYTALSILLAAPIQGFVAGGRRSFVQHDTSLNANLRMDSEGDFVDIDLSKALFQQKQSSIGMLQTETLVEKAEASLGMPWKESIAQKEDEDMLLYMPFWEWHMAFLKDNLTNLKVLPCKGGDTDFSLNQNDKKKARIVSMCFSSDEYSKIRMTYYDAGENTQVFNAVCYPDPSYNLPILGIDLLAFNRKKYLAIVDFQPIHDEEKDHATTFEHILEPIKNSYESLQGRMSSKFYDETKFFSQQMLFSRFDDENIVTQELFPAFTQYVQSHLELLRSTKRDESQRSFVRDRQTAYNDYSAERDPATGLFAAMFGKEWAHGFVHEFLFSHAKEEQSQEETKKSIGILGDPTPVVTEQGTSTPLRRS
eukprot:CAMPEP_0118696714 /NCGR_PEP_ID=MMETSP0800-20121206/14025_1 /TAXON_ID=210618 ORGANISM="Striatella unipunctata, Strain CCMP2910" /NCGR_SAMPLE_ID=MMETSP0800 /ASSEMBLY_ACC=CAM_ASM_000638 /LENGTH=369 /DNA_ID=CAMNT_0006595907 /DNA_START=132 /DNA_END=1241 /DNA_ORIENTATION=+